MLNLSNLNCLTVLERGSGGKSFLAKNRTFSANLTTDLFASGKGSATPTFTRATAADILDHDGYLRDVLSGEARFYGARRVRNQYSFPQAFSNAVWSKSLIASSTFTGISDPFGGTTAMKLVVDNGTSVIGNDGLGSIAQTITKTASVAQVMMISVYAKAGEAQVLRIREATTSGYRAVFNLVTQEITYENSATAQVYNAQMQSVGNGWYRCSVRFVTGTGATQNFVFKGCGAGTSTTGDGVSGIFLAFAQLEDVTGKKIQASSDYISTNVLSAPFHGANVDGVKYYSNELQISQNLCRYSGDISTVWAPTDCTVSLDGTSTPAGDLAYRITDNAVNSSHRIAMPTDVTLTDLSYTAIAYIKAGTKDTAVFRLANSPFDQGGRLHISSISAMTYAEVITGTSTMTSSMVDVGNGWRKVTINVTFPATISLPMYVLFYTGGDTNTYVGTGQYIVVGSVTIRQNNPAVADTYIPTTIRAIQNVTGVYTLPTTTTLGYLSETAATNLLLQSEVIDSASWVKVDTTITANNIASPDGYTTADLCTEGSLGTASISQTSAAYTANTPVTFSVYLKRGNTDWIRLTQTGSVTPADSVRAWFNLATGTKGSVQVAGVATQGDSSIQALNNGWYRCTITYLPNATETTTNVFIMSATADVSVTRVNGATFYAWGGQCETGLGETTYIVTTAATVTRNGDVLTYDGALNADRLVGTVSAETVRFRNNGATSGRIIGYTSASPLIFGSSALLQAADGTNFPAVSGAMAIRTMYKVAMCYGGVTQSLSRGNPSAATSLDQAYDGDYGATLTIIGIGTIGSSNQPNGCVRNLRIYKVKVSNTQLTSLTS